MTMSAVDFLDQWFETDVLKATMSASGIIGTFLGVRSPGTAYVLLHHYMGEIDGAFRSWGLARGGTGAISESIAARRARRGVEIRTEAPIAKIVVRDNRARGVVLENGDEIEADLVASSVDPRRTFLTMVGEELLPDEFVEGVKRYRVPRLVRQGESRARRAARTSRRCPAPGRICAARSRSRPASTTWSAPTTTRSTDGSRGGRTWTS